MRCSCCRCRIYCTLPSATLIRFNSRSDILELLILCPFTHNLRSYAQILARTERRWYEDIVACVFKTHVFSELFTNYNACVRVHACMSVYVCTGGIIHLLLITFIIIHVSFPSSYENVPNSLEFIEQGHVYTHIIIYAEYIIYSYGQAMPYRLHFFHFSFVCLLACFFVHMHVFVFIRHFSYFIRRQRLQAQTHTHTIERDDDNNDDERVMASIYAFYNMCFEFMQSEIMNRKLYY